MSPKSKPLIGLAAASLLTILAGAPDVRAEGIWLTDPKTGCKIWDQAPEPGESASWDGPCQDGLSTGTGTLLWFKDGKPNGSYVGERVGGKANGHGVNIWPNGQRYEGSWKDELFNGKGTYTWPDGTGYQGEWRDSLKHGKGRYVLATGDRFDGLYQNNLPVSGIYTKLDGTRYVAKISDGAVGPGERLYSTEDRLSVRQVGTKVCRPGVALLGLLETRMVGFVEAVGDTRVQIRIADPGTLVGQSYQGLPINQNSIIWDDPDSWGPC